MKVARLASGVWIWACLTACAQRSSEPHAAAVSATAATEAQAPMMSPGAAPAPAPPAEPQGLDQPKSKAAEEPEFTSLEAAERALNQAKTDLDRLALAEPSPTLANESAADRRAEKKPSNASRAPSAAGAAAPVKSNAVCEEACRAFSSLSRAAGAVCRLDGSSGTHCSRAKQVLASAEQRVARCSCQASSD